MKLQQTIKQIILEDINNKSYKIKKLVKRYLLDKYPKFVCDVVVYSPGSENFREDGEPIINYHIRVIFKKMDGDWVAREYEDKVLDEVWELVYSFFNIPVSLHRHRDPDCGENLSISIIESRFLKRRVDPEGIDSSLKDALDYVSSKFHNKRSSWYRTDPEVFRRIVINIMMDHLHPKLSNWGTEDFPYDEVYDFLTEYYSQRILERYKELDENPPTQMETNESEITERCWKGYTQKGMKTMFGKRYPNCVKKTNK